ncbi:hypothetical protein C2S52_002429 [Perilla frutescens var. hirtella]|nr:hypothetical protein C2S52_002429 [Perilla frutescens var. hirtella]
MESNRSGNLPEDLVHEILLRLPVKPLLRCKCVCKEWCALIRSPSFVDRHFSHESNHECLIVFTVICIVYPRNDNTLAFAMYRDNERHSLVEESIHLPLMPINPLFLHLLGPSNGVFCVLSLRGRIALFNPAMREFKTLPPLPLHDESVIEGWLVWGFGLEPSSGDYKVVALQKWRSQIFAHVYNLSSNSWKRIEAVDSLNSAYIEGVCNPFLNGVCHWHAKLVNGDGFAILAFDMRNEKFQVIQVPDCLRPSPRKLRTAAYGDSLAVMSYDLNECVDLWVMGRDGLWSKSFSIGPFAENVWLICVEEEGGGVRNGYFIPDCV